MSSAITVVFEQRRYVWDDGHWHGAIDYMAPPKATADRLNAIVEDQLATEDARIVDQDELLIRAKQARAAGQILRALKLARRAYSVNRGSIGAAAVLCGILRELRRPQEAIEISDHYRGSRYAPILTSRAAALCDVGRWEEALRQIRQVLAIGIRDQGSGSAEAFAVFNRIKAHCA